MSHISRITSAAQAWIDELDALGALASVNDLQRMRATAPAGVDPELLEMVQDAIQAQLQWPPIGYVPSVAAGQLIDRIDAFLGA